MKLKVITSCCFGFILFYFILFSTVHCKEEKPFCIWFTFSRRRRSYTRVSVCIKHIFSFAFLFFHMRIRLTVHCTKIFLSHVDIHSTLFLRYSDRHLELKVSWFDEKFWHSITESFLISFLFLRPKLTLFFESWTFLGGHNRSTSRKMSKQIKITSKSLFQAVIV